MKQKITPPEPAKAGSVLKKLDLNALRAQLATRTEERKAEWAAHWDEVAARSDAAERNLAQHLAETGGPLVEVESVSARPAAGGQWRVVAKGTHATKGPVYRFGFVPSLLMVALLLERWNTQDEWTADKYRST